MFENALGRRRTQRRRFQRFHFEGTVKLYSDKAMWESKLDDISLKGVLIEHPPGWNGWRRYSGSTAPPCTVPLPTTPT